MIPLRKCSLRTHYLGAVVVTRLQLEVIHVGLEVIYGGLELTDVRLDVIYVGRERDLKIGCTACGLWNVEWTGRTADDCC